MLGRALSELSLERWAVSERGASGLGPRRKDWTIRRAATPARDGPPASREIAGPRPGDGGAPFPMRTGCVLSSCFEQMGLRWESWTETRSIAEPAAW